MGRKIDVAMTVRIRVDETEWANEYGMAVGEVAGDVGSHLSAYVDDLVKRARLGYLFEAVTTSAARIRVEA